MINRIRGAFLYIVSLGIATVSAAQVDFTTDSLTLLVREVCEKHDVPAMALGVIHSGHTIISVNGVLERGGEAPIRPDHRFHLGSCTKAMTATLIGLLVEDGKLTWETRVLDVFPEAAESARDAYAEITLHDLLAHRAGLRPATAAASEESIKLRQLSGSPREQREKMPGVMLALSPVVEPGTRAIYSNAGYGIAAAMIERVMDEPYEDLMKSRLFEPLGLSRAGFGWPAAHERPDEPLGHWATGGRVSIDFPYDLPPTLTPAGDVHCTIVELTKFAEAHLKAMGGDESGLIPPGLARVLHDTDRPLGWVHRSISGGDALWHNGSAGTFFGWMTIRVDLDAAVVVLTNSGAGEQACSEVTRLVFEIMQRNETQESDKGDTSD